MGMGNRPGILPGLVQVAPADPEGRDRQGLDAEQALKAVFLEGVQSYLGFASAGRLTQSGVWFLNHEGLVVARRLVHRTVKRLGVPVVRVEPGGDDHPAWRFGCEEIADSFGRAAKPVRVIERT